QPRTVFGCRGTRCGGSNGRPSPNLCRLLKKSGVADSAFRAARSSRSSSKGEHMSDLVRASGGFREDRRVGRELAKLDAQSRLALAHVEASADVHVARMHGLAYVGKQALHAAALVSEVEQQLCR